MISTHPKNRQVNATPRNNLVITGLFDVLVER